MESHSILGREAEAVRESHSFLGREGEAMREIHSFLGLGGCEREPFLPEGWRGTTVESHSFLGEGGGSDGEPLLQDGETV